MSLMIRRQGVVCLMIAACHAASTGAQERGLVQTSAESVAGWPIAFDRDAKRVYHEDYESGKCDRIRPDSSAAVVSREDGASVHAGTYCLRGNFDPKTTDPITRKQAATKSSGLADIELAQAGVKDRMYVSYWWRLDATNKFVAEPPGNFGGQKHAYITASAEPWIKKVNCVVGQAWGRDHWWIVNNSPDPATVRYGGNARVAAEHAELGVWHHIEYYLRLNSVPLERDGVALLKVDGSLYIDLRDVPFIHTVPQTWHRTALPSMFGGGTAPLESFGWQMDDLEIWDGLPNPASEMKPAPARRPQPREPARPDQS